MQRKMAALIVGIAMVSWSGVALAHEGHQHEAADSSTVMGTVTAVHKDMRHIVVKDKSGKKVGVSVNDQTKYLRGTEAATFDDVTVGTRVVVSVTGEGDHQTATEVKLPDAKSKAPASDTSATEHQH
jgi:hypothetical protein